MKKPLIYGTLIITLATSSVGIVASKNATAELNEDHQDNVETHLEVTNSLPTTNETVYIITDHTGTKNKTFINNTLDTKEHDLPIEITARYYLDGKEITAEELVGKSGHVKIRYEYRATKTYQDKLIPFLVITGTSLDSKKFTNVELENGKIVSENDSLMVAGYGLAGLNHNLKTDFLPESFTIEADVKDFALDTVYTVATNEILADIDTSKLNSVDEIINAANQLANGLNQIISGASELNSGAEALVSGIDALKAGADELASGADQLATGASELANGLDTLVEFDNSILAKTNEVVEKVTAKANGLIVEYEIDPALVAEITTPITEYYNQIYTGVTTYTGSIAQLADGAHALKAGASELATGNHALANGISELAAGANKLNGGTKALKTGLEIFKTSGIDKLVSFANQDLSSLKYNLQKSVEAAKSYHHYDNIAAKSVKFIFKTPSIK